MGASEFLRTTYQKRIHFKTQRYLEMKKYFNLDEAVCVFSF